MNDDKTLINKVDKSFLTNHRILHKEHNALKKGFTGFEEQDRQFHNMPKYKYQS